MDRRAFLLGASGTASALAGCADIGALGGERAGLRDLPERPADLTPESVEAYVAAYEAARAHNRHARAGATEVSVDAVATFDYAVGDERFATAQHAGTARYEDDGDRAVGELYGRPVPYLVAPDRTLRMPVERRRVGGGASGGTPDATSSPPLGVRLCNATDEPREFAVAVVRREGDAGGESVLSTAVGLGPACAVELLGIADAPGGYRVTASMEADGVTGQGRIDVGLPGVDRGPNADVVVGDSGVSAWHLPPFEGV